MSDATRVAVIGTGVIGASWCSCFLAAGLDVAASDPAPGAEVRLRATVAAQWPAMERLGLAPGASRERLRFHPGAEAAAEGADFVQENGPERIEAKRALFALLDRAAPEHAVLATSSSTLMASEVCVDCERPERVLVGHPFNPPHLIPLVEVVGGPRTGERAVEAAMRFYARCGKTPVRLKRERRGHVANRLQAALWQEAIHLLREGVCDAADVDAAIAHGPGLRWALLGPFLNMHLSGGEGGIGHMLEHLGPPVEAMWRDLGRSTLDAETCAALTEGVAAELAGRDQDAMVARRDDVLLTLLALKREGGALP